MKKENTVVRTPTRLLLPHTPGPFKVLDDGDGNEIKIIHTSDAPGAIGTIAKVFARKCWREEGRANARLFAAAPDLLRELKRWREFARNNQWTDADHHDADGTGWISAMDAAIEKAEKGEW